MAICEDHEILSDADYMVRFSARLMKEHVPVCGSLELTAACNLNCLHCYERSSLPGNAPRAHGMDTAAHLRIIDEITQAGCLYLLLTGGEPLLRPDFPEIYARAKRNGLMVTVFTNGTLITDSVLDLFADLLPRKVEISIYGASAATHDEITGVPGSFVRTRNGIERLIERGVPIGLKTILMTHNRDEFGDIEKMARDYGAGFRFDPTIFPRMDGGHEPISLRLSPDEIVRIEFSDREKISSWQRFFATHRNITPTDRLYVCRAGITSFWIDAFGNLRPCVMVRRIKIDIADIGFAAGWEEIVAQMGRTVTVPGSSCGGCAKKALCGYCPGFFELESGSELKQSDFLCAIGQQRLDFLNREQPVEV